LVNGELKALVLRRRALTGPAAFADPQGAYSDAGACLRSTDIDRTIPIEHDQAAAEVTGAGDAAAQADSR